ncbi:bifunctional adenosylcobinamide kinase/adenosylcobinamide-phosphate guanylyltransferase [Peribacillus deserti]|uniref:Adenosylcobinamide kinase n=1 Tax=Peribacillus deserti TaxID=673318 RepID=A0A2N5M8Z3_9BACI|nr:bifunctional adenosylcobinamide kinase/adenosylcobinamide-phosphate guanylyltransferase [Peribacillus deserti]PLT30812.1 adenosylcobinamide kinase [Peribacillus deserti]
MITFISGGARSGKSTLAEHLAEGMYHQTKKEHPNSQLCYIATAKRSDFTGDERIDLHIQQRGKVWETIEEPYILPSVFTYVSEHSIILLDCLTVWTSNMMFSRNLGIRDMEDMLLNFLKKAADRQCSVFIVSNDVNEGMPSKCRNVQAYTFSLEAIHKLVIAASSSVIQTVAGIPIWWKRDRRLVLQ